MHCMQNAVTIKGIYDNGKIIFTDEPPVKSKTEVTITFHLDNIQKPKRILGGLEGKIITPDDFNDPLDDSKDYM